MNQVATIQPRSVTGEMAIRFGMEPGPFEATLRATVVPKDCTREQFAAFLMVARDYGLNPITREIFAFPTRAGGIQPIVSVDGWMQMINSHPQMDGLEFFDVQNEKDGLIAIKCRIYRKDRSHPTEVIEYMSECKRATDTWKTWPARMLRHKAAIQCARYAFGFSGIVEPDEFERMKDGGSAARAVSPPSPPSPPPAAEPEIIPPPPKAPVATEAPLNPDKWLAGVTARFTEAPDRETLAEIWDTLCEPVRGEVFPPDFQKAQEAYDQNKMRLSGE